jgi:hypothetical protein
MSDDDDVKKNAEIEAKVHEAYRVVTTIGAAVWGDDGYDQLGRYNPYADKRRKEKEESAKKLKASIERLGKALEKDISKAVERENREKRET